jgi:hypothetical protein
MRNVKKGGTYLSFKKDFMIEMDNRTLQQKQGTNVCGFCVMNAQNEDSYIICLST